MFAWLNAYEVVDCYEYTYGWKQDCYDRDFEMTPMIIFLSLNTVWIHCVDFEAIDYSRWSIYTLKYLYRTLDVQHYIIAENGEIRNASTGCCGCNSAKPFGPYQVIFVFLYGLCYIVFVAVVVVGIEEMKLYF